jgi:hypothetical protein
MKNTLIGSSVILLLAACVGPTPEPRKPVDPTPVPIGIVVERTSLDAVFDSSFHFSGVGIDPASQARLVLDPKRGIYDVATGAQVFAFSTKQMAAATAGRPASFEDFAIIDEDRLVLIAMNDGYVVDRATQMLLNRFCYLPSDVQQQDPGAYQLSHSVAWSADELKIYAQPQTFSATNEILRAELGLFSAGNASPLEWQPFDQKSFNAGGMAVESHGSIWFGESHYLHNYDGWQQKFLKSFDVATMDLQMIDGLALDREKQVLVVLDSERRELVDVPLSVLR